MPRLTKQKRILSEKLAEFTHFFTAEELHHKAGSKVGIATVYRWLNKKVQKQEIHSFQCSRKTIYSTVNTNHSHFKCEICGSLKHVEIKDIGFLDLQETICHFQIDITGICLECRSKEESS